MKKILVVHSVFLNVGDAFLIMSLEKMLIDIFGNIDITIACDNAKLCSNKYPQYRFIENLEKVLQYSRFKLIRYFDRVLNTLKIDSIFFKLCPLKIYKDYYKACKESDLIILAPGGYLNDYYTCDTRFEIIKKIININSNVFIIGQSLGPFKNIDKYKQTLEKLKIIITRESYSYNLLKKVSNNVITGTDIAFYYRFNIEHKFTTTNKSNIKVVLNFRSWYGDTNEIVEKAIVLCNYLIKEYDAYLYFISTCQGLVEYVNDALIAKEIVDRIDKKGRTTVLSEFLTPTEYAKVVSECDFYVGMRLHGGIISILNSIPCFIIGYEKKSEYIFNDLGIGKYEIHYGKSINEWMKKMDEFLTTPQEVLKDQKQAVEKAKEILSNLKTFIK